MDGAYPNNTRENKIPSLVFHATFVSQRVTYETSSSYKKKNNTILVLSQSIYIAHCFLSEKLLERIRKRGILSL